ARRLVHELQSIGPRVVAELIVDPLHGLLDQPVSRHHRSPQTRRIEASRGTAEPSTPGPPRRRSLVARFALEGRLPLLVQVFHARDVLDGAPGRSRAAAHGVHQGLADLVFGGSGLLRSREAAGHSGRAASRGHGGQRDQLQRLGVEGPLTIVDSGELFHLTHRFVSSLGRKWVAPALYGPRLDGPDHANWPLTTVFLWPKWLGRPCRSRSTVRARCRWPGRSRPSWSGSSGRVCWRRASSSRPAESSRARSASTAPRWCSPTRSSWPPAGPARTWARGRSCSSRCGRALRSPPRPRSRPETVTATARRARGSSGRPFFHGARGSSKARPSDGARSHRRCRPRAVLSRSPGACPTAASFPPTRSVACSTTSCATRARRCSSTIRSLDIRPCGAIWPRTSCASGSKHDPTTS